MRFRSVVFWLHLVAGLVAGAVVGIMCVTGVALAFEKEIVAWAERDARRVTVPAHDAVRLSLAELTERVRVARPTARPQAITVSADPRDAVVFSFGRDDAVYVDPYTGAVRAPASTAAHRFMQTMIAWHRWIALDGDNRPLGKAISGACNLAFCFLAVSGLYLWWPRSLTWRSVRAVAVFNFRLAGKARDFNWHNSIGLWSAPVLIVLTLTALPISYRWAANGVYRLVGETPPPAGAPTPSAPVPPVVPPGADARPLSRDALFKLVRQREPRATEITLRLVPGDVAPAAFTLREPGAWPRTATATLTLHPFTGDTLRRETFDDFSTGRQIRTWTRFLHTGEALGKLGQLVALLASLGGCVLVYTGFALAWRRFFPRRETPQL